MNSHHNTTNNSRFAYVSLGSNQCFGDLTPEQILKSVFEELRLLSNGEFQSSSIYRSVAIDCAPGTADFLNAAAKIELSSSVSASSFLEKLLSIETEYGRLRCGAANAPRTLDLDLIHVEGSKECSKFLVLPHPRAHERLFVLAPLKEMDPNLILSGRSETVSELVTAIGSQQSVFKYSTVSAC